MIKIITRYLIVLFAGIFVVSCGDGGSNKSQQEEKVLEGDKSPENTDGGNANGGNTDGGNTDGGNTDQGSTDTNKTSFLDRNWSSGIFNENVAAVYPEISLTGSGQLFAIWFVEKISGNSISWGSANLEDGETLFNNEIDIQDSDYSPQIKKFNSKQVIADISVNESGITSAIWLSSDSDEKWHLRFLKNRADKSFENIRTVFGPFDEEARQVQIVNNSSGDSIAVVEKFDKTIDVALIEGSDLSTQLKESLTAGSFKVGRNSYNDEIYLIHVINNKISDTEYKMDVTKYYHTSGNEWKSIKIVNSFTNYDESVDFDYVSNSEGVEVLLFSAVNDYGLGVIYSLKSDQNSIFGSELIAMSKPTGSLYSPKAGLNKFGDLYTVAKYTGTDDGGIDDTYVSYFNGSEWSQAVVVTEYGADDINVAVDNSGNLIIVYEDLGHSVFKLYDVGLDVIDVGTIIRSSGRHELHTTDSDNPVLMHVKRDFAGYMFME